MIFSFDALAASTIVLSGFLLFLSASSGFAHPPSVFAAEKAVFLADSLVKNRFPENPVLGACVFDSERQRVLEGFIDYSLLSSSSPSCFGGACVKRLCLESRAERECFFDSFPLLPPAGEACASVRRMVVLDSLGSLGSLEKAIVEVGVCQ